MQWLIDLVIEAIGVPPCYIDRGDPAAPDFDKTDLVTDETWRELDLSDIVPEGASAVHLRVRVVDNAVNSALQFRKSGNANVQAIVNIITQVNGIGIEKDCFVALTSTRIIEYKSDNVTWGIANIFIKGWIL